MRAVRDVEAKRGSWVYVIAGVLFFLPGALYVSLLCADARYERAPSKEMSRFGRRNKGQNAAGRKMSAKRTSRSPNWPPCR
jgi:hypothetical protein